MKQKLVVLVEQITLRKVFSNLSKLHAKSCERYQLTLYTFLLAKKLIRRRVFVAGPQIQYEIDLVHIRNRARFNLNKNFILVVIDMF